jgi:hypothetical protein
MSNDGASFPERCDYCGTQLGEEVRYPTATVDGENGSLQIFTFCDEECKANWQKNRSEEPDRR